MGCSWGASCPQCALAGGWMHRQCCVLRGLMQGMLTGRHPPPWSCPPLCLLAWLCTPSAACRCSGRAPVRICWNLQKRMAVDGGAHGLGNCEPLGTLVGEGQAPLWCAQVMELMPPFARSMQAAQARHEGKEDDTDEEEDEDMTKGIARLFAEVGEAYITLIASGTNPCSPSSAIHASSFQRAARRGTGFAITICALIRYWVIELNHRIGMLLSSAPTSLGSRILAGWCALLFR